MVVTNYNYEKYVARCIRSLMEQSISRNEFEVIVVDDNSSDSSLEILRNFHDDIRLIQLDSNVGLASASNIGINQAKGRYIVRVDSDDFVHPEFLRTLAIYMEMLSADFDAVQIDYCEVSEGGQILSIQSAPLAPIACGILYKSEVLVSLGSYKNGLRIHEDVDLARRFQAAGLRMGHLPIPLYRYVKHENSLSRNLFR